MGLYSSGTSVASGGSVVLGNGSVTRSKLTGTAVPGIVPLGTYTVSAGSYYSIDNIFTSTYSQYTIYFNNLTYAASGRPFLKLIDTAGTIVASSIYWNSPFSHDEGDGSFTNGGLAGNTGTKTQWWMAYRYPYQQSGYEFSGYFTIINPYQANNTSMHGFNLTPTPAQVQYTISQGYIFNTTQYRGISFSQDSGNITGGTITVYAHYAA